MSANETTDQQKVHVILDERERGKIRKAFRFLEQTQGKKMRLQIETMDFGDYLVSSRIAIERKRGDDLVSSIFDNRLFEQLIGLKEYFEQPVLILENPKKIFRRPTIKEGPIYGALLYVAFKMGVSVIPTINEKETAELVYALAKNEQNRGFLPVWPLPKRKVPIKKISRKDQEHFLQGMVQVGSKSAKRLLNTFGAPKYVFHALQETEVQLKKDGTPKKIRGMMEHVRGFGPMFVHRNKRLYTMSHKQAKRNKEKTY